MLEGLVILVVENEPVIALDICLSLVRVGGKVVGPAGTTTEALDLITQTFAARVQIAGAILDVDLADRDVTPIALVLHACAIPMIVYSATPLPPAVAALEPAVEIIQKPQSITRVIAKLDEAISQVRAPSLF